MPAIMLPRITTHLIPILLMSTPTMGARIPEKNRLMANEADTAVRDHPVSLIMASNTTGNA